MIFPHSFEKLFPENPPKWSPKICRSLCYGAIVALLYSFCLIGQNLFMAAQQGTTTTTFQTSFENHFIHSSPLASSTTF